MKDLHGQSSHFEDLILFLKRAREATSWVSTDTCCQSWLARYGIASTPYFIERGIYCLEDVKVLEIVHIFS